MLKIVDFLLKICYNNINSNRKENIDKMCMEQMEMNNNDNFVKPLKYEAEKNVLQKAKSDNAISFKEYAKKISELCKLGERS